MSTDRPRASDLSVLRRVLRQVQGADLDRAGGGEEDGVMCERCTDMIGHGVDALEDELRDEGIDTAFLRDPRDLDGKPCWEGAGIAIPHESDTAKRIVRAVLEATRPSECPKAVDTVSEWMKSGAYPNPHDASVHVLRAAEDIALGKK